MESNDVSELLQALGQETEPDSRVLCRLLRNPVNLHDISALKKALRFAVVKGFLTSMRILLEAGVSPNIKMGPKEDTPLHVFCSNKQGTEMVRELLKHGADVHAEDLEERSPLHYASSHQCIENMQELLENGASVDALDEDGETPLLVCLISSPDVSTIQVLLDAGADVNIRGLGGLTPLHYAVKHHLSQVIQLLLRHNADANVRDDDGETPLHCTASDYDRPYETIRELLKGGASLNALDNRGHSALYCAVHKRNKDATKELLRCGASFKIVECLKALKNNFSRPLPRITAIAEELIRYELIKNPFSLESVRQQLMQDRVVCDLRKISSLECDLEYFMHDCLFEVETLSEMSCECGKSSIWGSINNCEECSCDTHQAILKFLFFGNLVFLVHKSNFSEAFFYKLSKEFLLEATLNLMAYFEFQVSGKHLILPWPCLKEIERHLSFEDMVLFLQSNQSKMRFFDFKKFLAFVQNK